MMRVADYVFKRIADCGGKHVFLVTGGGAMHLNDALRCEKRLTAVCCHHEQACAIAAEGYVRAGGKLGVVSVTTGPGGTNALTGVIGQWLDSIPVLCISGQVKFETTIASCPESRLRQLGDQEINIVDMVRPVTKYAVMVTEPESIRFELEKALYLAQSGRPGPVWLDIPLNVQGAEIDETKLVGFEPEPELEFEIPIQAVLEELRRAKRPAIIAGFGIRLAGAAAELPLLAEELNIPVLSTFNGFDVMPTAHPLAAGRIGMFGQRAGNFVLQNADLLLSIGSRNNIRQVSFNWHEFGRGARKIVVDIDPTELGKKTVRPDLAIAADAGVFIRALREAVRGETLPDWNSWNAWCRERRERYPVPGVRRKTGKVDAYEFMADLTTALPASTTLAAGNGTACVVLFQSGVVKPGQRIFWNSGCASMGYDLPAAIGAAFATSGKVVSLAGDGSVMMNLQELATIVYHRLDIKVFLLDNSGYDSIKQTQRSFFSDELIGCDDRSGVGFPDFLKIGAAFGLPVFEIATPEAVESTVAEVLASPGPAFCVVRLPEFYVFDPKLSSRKLPDGRMVSSPLEDMAPFLDREELRSNMIGPDSESVN